MVQQRSPQFKSGTVANDGTITIIFEPPPLGMVLTGTITVTDAPSGSIWQVLNTGQNIDVIAGTNSAADIQAHRNEVISITSSALLPGKVIHATYWALAEDETNAPFVMPGHDAQNLQSNYVRQVANTKLSASSVTNITVPISPTDRSIIILCASLVQPTVSIIGNITGINYFNFGSPAPANIASGSIAEYPIFGAIDTSLAIQYVQVVGTPQVIAILTPDSPIVGNKGNPTSIVDGVGTFGTISATATTGTTVTLQAAPSAGELLRVRLLVLTAPTTVAAALAAVIRGLTSGVTFCGGWSVATGIFATVACDFTLTEGLQLSNATAVTATANAVTRIENAP